MLRIDREGHCVIWKINRPEAQNALNVDTLNQLIAAADAAARDGTIRAIVLTGEGKSFCSGGDLRELRTMSSPEHAAHFADLGGALCKRIVALHVPVIAAVSGPAFGGGAELALACDLRIADARAKFSFKQVRLGVTTAWGSMTRLSQLVGPGMAARLLVTAQEISAAEAKVSGLIDDLTQDGTCVTTALAWASDIEQGSPRAIAEMKALLRALREHGDLSSVERERFIATWTSPDHSEAMEAYFSRRPPVWRPLF